MLSDSEGEFPEDEELMLSRLSATNLTSRWSHGHSLTLFNVERRGMEVGKLGSSGKAGDSSVLRFTWDNFQLARQVRVSLSSLSSLQLHFPVYVFLPIFSCS